MSPLGGAGLVVAVATGVLATAGLVARARLQSATPVGRTRPPGGPPLAGGSGPPTRLVAAGRRWRDGRDFDRRLPLLLEALAAQFRAGEGPRPALLAGAAAAGRPFAGDVAGLAHRLELGMGLGDVVRWWATTRRCPELAALAVVLGPGVGWGGSLADALDGLAAAADDRRTIAAEARAHASQARASAALLVVAPVGFAAVMAVVDPRTTQFLFGTPAGWATVTVAVALDALGGWWMWRLTESVR